MTIAAMEYVIRSTFGHSRCNHNSSNTYTCTNANCGCTITVRAKAQVCVDKQGRTTQTRYRAHIVFFQPLLCDIVQTCGRTR
jgi:hypothetical protein